MNEFKNLTVVEDSKRNKYMFLYKNNSIYCNELKKDSRYKESLLVSQVNLDYKITIDNNDIIYVICNSKEKGLVIYSHENNRWKFNQILSMQNYSNIVLIKAYIYKKSIHVIYAKKMPVSNLYNIYHIYSSDKGIINSSWKKNSVTELYAYNNAKNNEISNVLSTTIEDEKFIHLVNVWHNGTNFSITYCLYDFIKEIWNKKNIDIDFEKEISLKLLANNSKLHLLCMSGETDVPNIHYYIKNDTDTNFKFIGSSKLDIKSDCMFNEDNDLYCASIYNSLYSEYLYMGDKNLWEAVREYNIEDEKNIYWVEYFKKEDIKIINYEAYMMMDEKYNLLMPWKQQYKEYRASIKDKRKLYSHGEGKEIDPVKKHIPFILEEIQRLSQSIEELSSKINDIYDSKIKKSNLAAAIPSVSKGIDETQKSRVKNKSNFKESFMSRNTFISKPSAAMIYVGDGSIPNITANNNYKANVDPSTETQSIISKEDSSAIMQSDAISARSIDEITPESLEDSQISSNNTD